jgi:hypothetical protein
MNELVNNKNFFAKALSFIRKKYKLFTILIFFLVVLYGILNLYLISQKNIILSTSINFNNTFSNKQDSSFQKEISLLALEKNFFGILALLEKIKIDLSKNEIYAANDTYLNLLKNNSISELYKTAIAIHGSYLFLDQLNPTNQATFKLSLDELKIIKFIENLLSFVDPSFESYDSFRFEILYLISIIKQDNIDTLTFSEESINLYKLIQENVKIPSSIKERIKKIHEFKTYK